MKLEELIGNEQTKAQLTVAARAALADNRPLPHAIFGGAPGCGKTATSKALSGFLGRPFFQVDASSIKTAEDLLDIFDKFSLDGYSDTGDVIGKIDPPILFLDEIHNMPLKGQEHLGIAMENWVLPVSVKQGKQRKQAVLWLPRFTVIGATTMTGKISRPMLARFKLQFRFKTYSGMESAKIVLVQAVLHSYNIDLEGALSIASRGRGVPRTLVRFLEMANDYARLDNKEGLISGKVAESMFEALGIDPTGLTGLDRSLLTCLYENREAPVGLDSLAIFLDEYAPTVANELEPFLIRQGLMLRTSRGRILTQKGVQYVEEVLGVTTEASEKETPRTVLSVQTV